MCLQFCDMKVLAGNDSIVKDGDRYRAAFRRPGLLAAFVSNCGVTTRDRWLRELAQELQVDHYGVCFHNVDVAATRSKADWVLDKEVTLKSYRFAIAFENKVRVARVDFGCAASSCCLFCCVFYAVGCKLFVVCCVL
jgi:hypothetical protein